jgi:pimeloyl-ACP methyl ester carboxylesterase
MPTCQYKHIPVNFTDAGKGPAVVLLHGYLENLGMWQAFAKTLSTRFRVVCIDLLGHGKTPSLGYVHPMEDFADAVKAVLDHLRLRKYAVIGHSMGGYVALALAEAFPDNIRALGLFYSTAKEDSEEKKEMRLRAMEAIKHNHKTFVRTMIPGLFTEENKVKYQKEIEIAIAEALTMSKQSVLAAMAGMRERKDREALLHFAPYPVLIISGKHDPRISLAEMQPQMAAPNVQAAHITEHGHMGHIEDSEKCLFLLSEFLKNTR